MLRVNNHDMESTFNYGDVVLIKKAFNKYNTNDFLLFKYPLPDSSVFGTDCIQRLIALPGDTVELIDKGIAINNFSIPDSATILHNYYVKTDSLNSDSFLQNKFNLRNMNDTSERNKYCFSLSTKQVLELKLNPAIKSLNLKSEPKGYCNPKIFPNSINVKWNMDYFGKLFLPKKNDIIHLDTLNILWLWQIIKKYENNKIEIKNNIIYINDTIRQNYKVKNNYYFVLGDNRDNANDSRVFGYLPEKYIKGKVIMVLKRGN